MSQCVPSWDLDHPHETSNSLPHDVPLLDYEVAELTWENGQPSMHGLGLPRVAHKYANVPPCVTISGDTLESVVNQATTRSHASATNELVPWFDHHHEAAPKTTTVTHHSRAFMDALVPCNNTNNNSQNQNQKKKFITTNNYNNNNNNSSSKEQQQQHSTTHVQAGISTCMVGSCSGVARTRNFGAKMNLSENGGGKIGGGRDHHQHRHRHMAGMEGSEYLGGGGFTSEISPENTSSGGLEYTRTSGDDSVCHSMSQRETCDEEIVKKRSGILGKSSVSTKRSRAAAIHNQSERRRRDKINQRMKTLQKLVPNSSKTDKASMLDEVIEYLKQLQTQVYLMSRMNTISPMTMLPLIQHQQLQMPCMNMMPPGIGLGMGMGLGLGSLVDFNTLIRATGGNTMPPPHAIQPNANFMSALGSWDNSGTGDHLAASMPPPPHDALSAFLACQMQPMTMDSYSRLAAMYQQFHQTPPSASKE